MKTMLLTDFNVLSVRQKQRWFSEILHICAAHFCEVVKVSMLDLTRTLQRQQLALLWQSFLPQDEKLKIIINIKKKKS